MNNTFQLNRFLQFFYRIFEVRKRQLIRMSLIFAGTPFVFFLISLLANDNISALQRFPIITGQLIIVFLLSPISFFKNVNHSKKGLTDIMLPVSIFEKYLSMMIFCLIVTPLCVIVPFGLMDTILATIFPGRFVGFAMPLLFTSFREYLELWLSIHTSMQFIFLLNLIFIKNKITKIIATYIALFLAFVFVILSVVYLIKLCGYNNSYHFNYNISYITLFDFSSSNKIEIALQVLRLFRISILPIILMGISYRIFKNIKY